MAIRNRRIHHEHLAGAVDFLREASDAAHADPQIETRHIERRLIAATAMLAAFQEPLARPDHGDGLRDAWEFVRLSRILNFHCLETPAAVGAVKMEVKFDMKNDRGRIVARGGRFRMALDRVNELSGTAHKKKQEDIDAAIRFAKNHDNDLWEALKAACYAFREIAEAPSTLLDGLDDLTLPELVTVVDVSQTESLRGWLKPILDEHTRKSPPHGPVIMTDPIDPPKRGELDE